MLGLLLAMQLFCSCWVGSSQPVDQTVLRVYHTTNPGLSGLGEIKGVGKGVAKKCNISFHIRFWISGPQVQQ